MALVSSILLYLCMYLILRSTGNFYEDMSPPPPSTSIRTSRFSNDRRQDTTSHDDLGNHNSLSCRFECPQKVAKFYHSRSTTTGNPPRYCIVRAHSILISASVLSAALLKLINTRGFKICRRLRQDGDEAWHGMTAFHCFRDRPVSLEEPFALREGRCIYCS